jgi:hypothetical protein
MGAALSTLLYAALRVARITGRAGRAPSIDQFLEAMAIFNRMVASWSAVRLNIFQLLISQFAFVAGRQMYTIGPGGTGPYWLGTQSAAGAVRPSRIARANLFISSNPTPVRRPIGILEAEAWADKRVQQVAGPPSQLYNDRASPVSTLYAWPIPDQSYPFELYTWSAIAQATALSNQILLPPEYEEAIVYQLARRIPGAQLSAQDMEIGRRAVMVLQSLNTKSPRLSNDAAGLGGGGRRADFNWATGEPWK